MAKIFYKSKKKKRKKREEKGWGLGPPDNWESGGGTGMMTSDHVVSKHCYRDRDGRPGACEASRARAHQFMGKVQVPPFPSWLYKRDNQWKRKAVNKQKHKKRTVGVVFNCSRFVACGRSPSQEHNGPWPSSAGDVRKLDAFFPSCLYSDSVSPKRFVFTSRPHQPSPLLNSNSPFPAI